MGKIEKIEKVDDKKVKITYVVDEKEFDKIEQKVFNSVKNSLSCPGFRQGKVTREIAYKVYGRDFLLADTMEDCVNSTYIDLVNDYEEEVLSSPKIEVIQMKVGEPFIYSAEVLISPKVKLGKYKGVEVTVPKKEIKDKDIEEVLKKEQMKNSRLINVNDRGIKEGDFVNIDFILKVDGKESENRENIDIEIGTKTFIEDVEEKLKGMKVGEESDIKFTFGKEIQDKTFADKETVLYVKINEIKERELPTINDDFISEISEFDTLEEYKKNIKKELEKILENEKKEFVKNEVLKEVIKATNIKVDDEAIDYQVNILIDELQERLDYYKMTLERYLEISEMTLNEFKKSKKEEAEDVIKSRIVLNQIAEDENLKSTEEQINETIKENAEKNQMEFEEYKNKYVNKAVWKTVKINCTYKNAMKFLLDNAKVK